MHFQYPTQECRTARDFSQFKVMGMLMGLVTFVVPVVVPGAFLAVAYMVGAGLKALLISGAAALVPALVVAAYARSFSKTSLRICFEAAYGHPPKW